MLKHLVGLFPKQEKINGRGFKIDSNQALIEIIVSVRAAWKHGDKHHVQGAAGIPCGAEWVGYVSEKPLGRKRGSGHANLYGGTSSSRS